MPKVLIPADTTTGYIGTTSGIKSLGLAVGMTGAIQPSRYAGATTSGSPATGTFIAGDFIIDLSGAQWVCTTGGTPGTWAKIASVGSTAAGASAVGDTAVAGTGGTASRVDHVHGREAFAAPSSLSVSQSQSTGSALTVNHSDHQHAMPGSGTPGAVTGGATATAGVASTLALSDHVHSTSQLAILNTTNTFTTSLTVSAGSVTSPAVSISGLTGATAASRYVGATASGAPASGTFLVGDFTIDQTGAIHVCSTAGTVGSGAVFTRVGGTAITAVTFAESTAAPNATYYVDSITVAGSTTNVDLALVPKGYGSLMAQVPDGTAAGGNKRGVNAVDWQTSGRSSGQTGAAQAVASGGNSVLAGGYGNTANMAYATVGGGFGNLAGSITAGGGVNGYYTTVAGGQNNQARDGHHATVGGGQNNYVLGGQSTIGGGSLNTINSGIQWATISGGNNNIASGFYATVAGGKANTASTSDYTTVSGGFTNTASATVSTIPGGRDALAATYGKLAYASGKSSVQGDAQFGLSVLRGATTLAGTARLTADGAAAGATNIANLPTNSAFLLNVNLVATDTASPHTVGLVAVYSVLIRQGAAAAKTVVVDQTQHTLLADATILDKVITISADTTNGGLNLTVTGSATTNLRWVATVQSAEVG